MKFQLSIQHQNQRIVFNVRKAVYFENIVFQVFSEDLNFNLYEKNGFCQSNLTNTDEELIGKLAAAIVKQADEELVQQYNTR